jgi:hypothetical protein
VRSARRGSGDDEGETGEGGADVGGEEMFKVEQLGEDRRMVSLNEPRR